MHASVFFIFFFQLLLSCFPTKRFTFAATIIEIRSALQLVYIRLCLRTILLPAISGSSHDDITGIVEQKPFGFVLDEQFQVFASGQGLIMFASLKIQRFEELPLTVLEDLQFQLQPACPFSDDRPPSLVPVGTSTMQSIIITSPHNPPNQT